MKFYFEAFDGVGNLVEGDVEAATNGEAREIIRARGVTPYEVRASRGTDLLFREISLDRGSRRAPDAQLARLARDLAVLLQASLPLDTALSIAATTTEDKRMQSLALHLMEGVRQGATLAEVMEAMPGTFQPEYIRIVQAGDISADLGRAMQELADLLDRRVEIKRRIRSAMAYPALLVGLAFISLAIILGLLVPAVTPIFLENGMPLPTVLAALDAIRQNTSWILVFAAVSVVALVLGLSIAGRNEALRVPMDKLYLSIPIIGRIAELREAARFTRTLASLIRAGVPPLQALQASCPLVKNHYTRSRLEHAVTDVRAGVSIGTALSMASALPMVVQQMITVGEESGRLQDMLLRATLILERQEQMQSTRALAVLTPAVTILVGGMIAAIILSVMGAVLSINELALR